MVSTRILTSDCEGRSILIYSHYKGGIYKVLLISVYHTETNERLVIYENSNGKPFARPYTMFFGEVMVDDKMIPRFTEITPC